MSLINDALRRASASEKSSAPQSSAPVPPMQPVEPSPSSPVLPWAVMILGVSVLAIAATLWFRGRATSTKQIAQNESAAVPSAASVLLSETPVQQTANLSPAIQNETPVTTARQPVVTAAPAPAPEPLKTAPVSQPTPEPVQSQAPVVAAPATLPAPIESKPPEVQVAAAAPTPVETKSPALSESRESRPPRLQAIYYRLRKPTVIINGKTLGPGDSVDGIKVVSIQRTSVEVVQGGKYRTLTMQD